MMIKKYEKAVQVSSVYAVRNLNHIKLTMMQKTSDITSEQVLSWSKRVKVQRAQKTIVDATKENKEFNMIEKGDQYKK